MASIPLRLTCPNCGHLERMYVTAPLMLWSIRSQLQRKVETNVAEAKIAAGAAVCPNCNVPFGVTMQSPPNVSLSSMLGSLTPESVDAAFFGAKVSTFPRSVSEVKPDDSLPRRIREAFVFIQEDAKRKRNAPGILSGARGCLDVALKSLGETSGGRRDRINRLSQKGIITSSIADWAQTLWEDGSDAVHDLDADIERAIEHVEFLKLFFEVAFGLPARIERAQHQPIEQVEQGTDITPLSA